MYLRYTFLLLLSSSSTRRPPPASPPPDSLDDGHHHYPLLPFLPFASYLTSTNVSFSLFLPRPPTLQLDSNPTRHTPSSGRSCLSFLY
ncbi:hypothetical protein F5B22DRAFT_476329 [Xylaria bambusicola]|uniref:uncharacterized protein n=1 Tax=Xylaria bambusicola TaxID=326684 RepID=UPI0020075DB4|nr:uncharacterized protein F5B22DRAFT_476329 [Xylaria bambusicola]KAI0506183.1 hypothetical protein F5B22DRAFT_476329 [Xylaria bambusicola]